MEKKRPRVQEKNEQRKKQPLNIYKVTGLPKQFGDVLPHVNGKSTKRIRLDIPRPPAPATPHTKDGITVENERPSAGGGTTRRNGEARRLPQQQLYDRTVIMQRYLKNIPQHIIAEELGLDHETVSREVRTLRQEWLKSAWGDMRTLIVEQLKRLELIETEAWEAFERSKQMANEIVSKRDDLNKDPETGEPTPVGTTLISRTQYGDPRLLNVIQWCWTQRGRVLGIEGVSLEEAIRQADADKETAMTSWSDYSPEERASRIIYLLDTVKTRMLESRIGKDNTRKVLGGDVNGATH